MVSSNGTFDAPVEREVPCEVKNEKVGSNSGRQRNVIRMMTGIFIWILICIPSNIMAGIFYFKQAELGSNHSEGFSNPSINYNHTLAQYHIKDIKGTSNVSTIPEKVIS